MWHVALHGLSPLISSLDSDPGLSPPSHRRPRLPAVRGREDHSCTASLCGLLCLSNKVALGFLAILLLPLFLSGDFGGKGVRWPCPRIWGVLPESGDFFVGGSFLKVAGALLPSGSAWNSTMATWQSPFVPTLVIMEGMSMVALAVAAADVSGWIPSSCDRIQSPVAKRGSWSL
jgi:hypothetical protein